MNVREKIAALREQMKEQGLDAYLIPTNDFHGSEYVGEYFKTRKYISGFSGSAGTVIVLADEAGLWTDGRYFLQAQEQLQDTGITLFKMGEEGVPTVKQYLLSHVGQGQTLGFDGRMQDALFARSLSQKLDRQGATVRSDVDLVGEIWPDRPELSCESVFLLDSYYAGEERSHKLERLQRWMEDNAFDQYVLSSLDDIAWLLNLRGNDIACNPVFLSYFVMTKKDRLLFVQRAAVPEDVRGALEESGVTLCEYADFYLYLQGIEAGSRVAMDEQVANYAMLQAIPGKAHLCNVLNPTIYWKACKNPTEVANEKKAHIKDGVAVTKFIYWLKQNVDKLPLTEISAANQLEEFRAQGEHYMGPSFDTIAGFRDHGAIVHYFATPESDAVLAPESFLLVDSGGQYLEGTTDITRTIHLGTHASAEEKKYYTAVLRGNLNLAAAKFRYGCSGVALDILARQPLWDLGCDYNHGTGHGVGYLLNVHESPNAFRYRVIYRPGENVVLEEGMITSDEPGIYLEGKFGIRLENLVVCVKKEKNAYGQFMGLETLTMAPFDRSAIDPDQMSQKEKQLLNAYQETVYKTISPYLERNEAEWLADECAPF